MGIGVVKAHILILPECQIGNLKVFKKLEVEYYENAIVLGMSGFLFGFSWTTIEQANNMKLLAE